MSHVEDAYSVENEGGLITNDRFSDDTTTTLTKHRGSKNSTEIDPLAQSNKADEEGVLKRITTLRDELPSKLRHSGNLRDIPVERLLLDESLQIRPLNSVYVDELERFMSEGLWDWKKMVFTVFTRSFKMCGRTHLKYVVVDGNHRLRALLRFKLHDSGRTVPRSVSCRIYEELTLEECILLRRSQHAEESLTLPLTVRDMVATVRGHLVRLGYTFSTAVKLYVKGVDTIRLLLPANAPEFVIRMGCSCTTLYTACMRLLECFSAGNIKLSTSEMANVRPLYRFGKTEMFDLAKRSFWHSILTAFNKEPRRVLDIIEDIIGNRSSISEAEEALRFYLDPLSEIVVRMGVNNRREALEQLFGNADIDESVIQIVLSDEKILKLCRGGSAISISELHSTCTQILAQVAASTRAQSASESMDSGIETLAETILSESLADTHHSNFKTIESTRGNTSQIADSNNNALNHIRLETVNSPPGDDTDAQMQKPLRNSTEDALTTNTLVSQRSQRALRKRCCTEGSPNTSSIANRTRHSGRIRSSLGGPCVKRLMPTIEVENIQEDDYITEHGCLQSDTQFGLGVEGNVNLEAGTGDEEPHVDSSWAQSTLSNGTNLDDLTETVEKEFMCRSRDVIDQFMQNVARAALLHKREMARKVVTVLNELPTPIAEQLIAELKSLPKSVNALGVLLSLPLDSSLHRCDV
uniref:ParB/Sulfiredoxin domain-containing protein n=1 Tax=Ascaris lumbricoides TaxID=6252 RepID=A0A0M3HXM1_ASCLU